MIGMRMRHDDVIGRLIAESVGYRLGFGGGIDEYGRRPVTENEIRVRRAGRRPCFDRD